MDERQEGADRNGKIKGICKQCEAKVERRQRKKGSDTRKYRRNDFLRQNMCSKVKAKK
jgi:hypothetical protein